VKTRIQKWGNSLALRIPKSFATEAGLSENTAVDLSLAGGRIVVRAEEESLSLEALLEGITEDNIHGEWATGPAVGKEAL